MKIEKPPISLEVKRKYEVLSNMLLDQPERLKKTIKIPFLLFHQSLSNSFFPHLFCD